MSNREARIGKCMAAANLYRELAGEPHVIPAHDLTELAAYGELNAAIGLLAAALGKRFGGRAAAVELDEKVERSAGGAVVMYWSGQLYALGAGDFMQPLTNAPMNVRLLGAERVEDLIYQLEEE